MITAILLMGGSGERFQSVCPKQFHRLAGKKVYLYTLETFLQSQLFGEIVLVCPDLWIDQVKEDIVTYSNIKVVAGGKTRQESSLNGLLAADDQTQVVVIHDAVRPFVSNEILEQNIAAAKKYRAVDTCIPSADTLVYAPEGNEIAAIPLRSAYLRGQTPQSFDYSLILKAHVEAKGAGFCNQSDDCSLVMRGGHAVHVVAGSEENIKITSELDLFLAEQLFRLKNLSSASLKQHDSLEGKRIAITGGTGGIGGALCTLLKEEGAIPIVISRSAPEYSVDLTSYECTRAMFDRVGPLDGLVNSIGLLKNKELDQLTSEEIDSLIATNLTGVIYSCKCAQLNKGAHIINIASSSYSRGRKNTAIYSSAKAALVNFSQALAEEKEHLLVNVLVPKRTQTPMRAANFPDEDPATLLQPSEVASEIIALLKTRALTGTIVEVRKKTQNVSL